jgi:hypothetical protein
MLPYTPLAPDPVSVTMPTWTIPKFVLCRLDMAAPK